MPDRAATLPPPRRPRALLSLGLAAVLSLGAGPGVGQPPTPTAEKTPEPAGEPSASPSPRPAVDLSPARWPAGERERYRAIDFDYAAGPKGATGRRGILATSSQGGTSVRAGLEALRQGGSAVDAALVTALTQTALTLGGWTSYAGALWMVVYDAESGAVYALDAPFATVMGEDDPWGIPKGADGPDGGRTVLVPGFMAGAQAAHDRFGVLPWEELFAPAIYFATEGFELTEAYVGLIESKREVLDRLPAGRAIFRTPNGASPAAGDRFRQPALAATLAAVARDGADHMYRGPWAEELVAAARSLGGRLAMRDLRAYRPAWRQPLRGRYRELEVVTLGLPNETGVQAVEAFNLLAAAELDRSRPYWDDPRALYRLLQVARVGPLLSIAPVRAGLDPAELFPGIDLSPWSRIRPETARALWQRIERPDWQRAMRAAFADATPPASPARPAPHSDCVVAADERGNVVALGHSINTALWGTSGLFVGGVSISDNGSASQAWIAEAGPGQLLSVSMNPLLVLENGRPVAASAAIGRGLHEVTLQTLLYMLDLGLSPKEAIEAPQFLSPYYDPAAPLNREYYKQRVPEGDYDAEVLAAVEALGQALHLQPATEPAGLGFWVGLKIDPESGLLEAGAPAWDGWAEGY